MNILTPIKEKLQKERYSFIGDTIMKDGHSMFIEDVVKDLNKAKLQAISEVENLMKEKVGELKKELKTDLTGCFTSQKQCDEWNEDTNQIINKVMGNFE